MCKLWQNIEDLGTFKNHEETSHGAGIILINAKQWKSAMLKRNEICSVLVENV